MSSASVAFVGSIRRTQAAAALALGGRPTNPANRLGRNVIGMNTNQQESDGATRVAYILGVPLAENVVRQWPQMGEIVRTSKLVADVEGNFPELTLEVGRRLQLDDVVVVEWTCNYGDGRLYRNVTIGELEDGRSRARHRLLGRAHRDARMAPAADRSTRHARRRHLAGLRAPRPLLERAVRRTGAGLCA